MEEGRVLDDQRVRLADRLANADLTVVDPAVGDDRSAGALRSEGGERLGEASLLEGGNRQKLGRRDDALAATPVDADLEHATILAFPGDAGIAERPLVDPYFPAKIRRRSRLAAMAADAARVRQRVSGFFGRRFAD